MADPDRDLPDPGHEEPVCAECGGEGVALDGWELADCWTCRGTGRPRCPECVGGTVRTGPGPDDTECCDRCDGEGLL